jgi:hypothetical protein
MVRFEDWAAVGGHSNFLDKGELCRFGIDHFDGDLPDTVGAAFDKEFAHRGLFITARRSDEG